MRAQMKRRKWLKSRQSKLEQKATFIPVTYILKFEGDLDLFVKLHARQQKYVKSSTKYRKSLMRIKCI